MELDEFMAYSYGRNWRKLEQAMELKNNRLQGLQEGQDLIRSTGGGLGTNEWEA